jgi:hypothetical protein
MNALQREGLGTDGILANDRRMETRKGREFCTDGAYRDRSGDGQPACPLVARMLVVAAWLKPLTKSCRKGGRLYPALQKLVRHLQ